MEKPPKNLTPALTKNTNMDIWVVGTVNLRGSKTGTNFPKK